MIYGNIHYERIPPSREEFINTPITSCHILAFFFFFVRTLKFCSLSKCQLYHMVLATVVTMLHIRASDLTHLITLWVGNIYEKFITFWGRAGKMIPKVPA